MAVAESLTEARNDSDVYFCYDYAHDSFNDVLNEDYCMSEEQIKEFVMYSNPILYQQLHCLPFNSSDIPQSFHAQKQFRKAYEMQKNLNPRMDIAAQTPEYHASGTLESIPQQIVATDRHLDHSMMELQLKRKVQMSLLSKYFNVMQGLYLRR